MRTKTIAHLLTRESVSVIINASRIRTYVTSIQNSWYTTVSSTLQQLEAWFVIAIASESTRQSHSLGMVQGSTPIGWNEAEVATIHWQLSCVEVGTNRAETRDSRTRWHPKCSLLDTTGLWKSSLDRTLLSRLLHPGGDLQ